MDQTEPSLATPSAYRLTEMPTEGHRWDGTAPGRGVRTRLHVSRAPGTVVLVLRRARLRVRVWHLPGPRAPAYRGAMPVPYTSGDAEQMVRLQRKINALGATAHSRALRRCLWATIPGLAAWVALYTGFLIYWPDPGTPVAVGLSGALLALPTVAAWTYHVTRRQTAATVSNDQEYLHYRVVSHLRKHAIHTTMPRACNCPGLSWGAPTADAVNDKETYPDVDSA